MTSPLPARPSLDWLRKRARATLKTLRQAHPGVSLTQAQLAVAREYGFPSWRALKVEVDQRREASTPAPAPLAESVVADFLLRVGQGDESAVRAALAAAPGLVNAVGPHPFWGGRPQPLHVAIETNRPAMVRLLLRHGADVNGDNAEYLHWSPLLLTFHWRQPAVRRALLRRGARIGLVEALAMGDDRRVLRLLRPGRPALPAESPNGGSLLMFARTPRAIDRLLELGVSLDRKDRWGATPLEAFSRMGPRGRPLVRHLARRGVAVDPEACARMNDRKQLAALLVADPERVRRPTVFKAAVDFGHRTLVRWLLAQGTDPNARGGGDADESGLHSAAWNGDLEMVELLLAHGADPSLRDRQYHGTPAGWARTAREVTNNPRCDSVALRLERALQEHGTDDVGGD